MIKSKPNKTVSVSSNLFRPKILLDTTQTLEEFQISQWTFNKIVIHPSLLTYCMKWHLGHFTLHFLLINDPLTKFGYSCAWVSSNYHNFDKPQPPLDNVFFKNTTFAIPQRAGIGRHVTIIRNYNLQIFFLMECFVTWTSCAVMLYGTYSLCNWIGWEWMVYRCHVSTVCSTVHTIFCSQNQEQETMANLKIRCS